MPGTLFVVATPIGNLEDITRPGAAGAARGDVIAAEDTRRTAHLLARYAITTPTTSLHEHNENEEERPRSSSGCSAARASPSFRTPARRPFRIPGCS